MFLFFHDDLPCPRHAPFRMPKDKKAFPWNAVCKQKSTLNCLVEKLISAGFCRTMWMIRSAACFSLVCLVCLGGQYRPTSSILCIIFWNPERQQSFVQTLYTNAHPPSSLFCWRTNGVRLDTWQYSADSAVQTATRCTNKQAWKCHLWHTSDSMISKWRGKVLVQANYFELKCDSYYVGREV